MLVSPPKAMIKFFAIDSSIRKYAVGGICGVVITAFLSLIIIVGVSSTTNPEARSKYGAIKLSVLPLESSVVADAVYSTAAVASMEKFEMVESELSPLDVSVQQPELLNLEFDFTQEIAGTVALGGMPALAVGTGFGGGAYTIGEVDELPYAIYYPSPVYPQAMRRVGKELKVIVRILLDENGIVTAVEPINHTGETILFHQSAMTTIKKWRFHPCQKAGKSVSCVADQPITFTLNN